MKLNWKPYSVESVPKDRDFIVWFAYGYMSRARLVNKKHLAVDCHGVCAAGNDITPTHWDEVPEGPNAAP